MDVAHEQIRQCHDGLMDLASYCRDRLRHWQALPETIKQAIAYARRVQSGRTSSADERNVAVEIITTLDPISAYSELPQAMIASLVQQTLALLSLSRKLPGHDAKGSLWNQLHSTIQQHMESAIVERSDLQLRIETVATSLNALPDDHGKDIAVELLSALAVCIENLTIPTLRELAKQLDKSLEYLPPFPSATLRMPRALPLRTNRFRIAIIEDNPQWQDFVLDAVNTVKQTVGPSYSISTECFTNVQDALNALLPDAREISLVATEQTEPPVQTIVVSDMGLPANPADAAAILLGETTPDRANGHRLLAELRSYRTNIPVVVLTTPPHLLTDQINACRQGIQDYDYVLKGPDKEDRLVNAIIGHIKRAQAHLIEFWIGAKNEVRVDGVPIPLGEMPFRTFYAICQLSYRSRNVAFRLESILDQLDETFRDDYDYKRPPNTILEHALVLGRQRSGDWWRPKWETQIANVIRLWAARKADAGGNLTQAIELFKRENFQSWKDALQLFDLYRSAHPESSGNENDRELIEDLQSGTLEKGFEKTFGGLEVDKRHDYDLHNIEDHINQIRNEVHRMFKELHRFVEPRRELLVRRQIDDEYGYRVLGEITFHNDLGGLDDDEIAVGNERPANCISTGTAERVLSVLVVENEPSYLERIRSLLVTAGFEVRLTTNEEDAVAVGRMYRPDILCLDLHIPATRSEYENDPHSGDAEGGLRTLAALRELLPQLQVVLPTTLFNHDDLREAAARLSVPVTNIVPKGESLNGADWEGHLLLTLSRLRQEISSRAVLPALPPWLRPVVRVEPGDWTHGRLNLIVNGKSFRMQKSKQGLLLAVLLKMHDEVVSYGDIDDFVQGHPVTENTRKMWVKNLREKVRAEWLGLSADSPGRPELDVLETVQGGLVLHAFVEGLEA